MQVDGIALSSPDKISQRLASGRGCLSTRCRTRLKLEDSSTYTFYIFPLYEVYKPMVGDGIVDEYAQPGLELEVGTSKAGRLPSLQEDTDEALEDEDRIVTRVSNGM